MAIFDGDIIRVVVDQLWRDVAVQQHSWHVRYSGPTVVDQLQALTDIRDGFETLFYTTFDTYQSLDFDYTGYNFFNVSLGQPLGFLPPNTVLTGNDAQHPISPQAALLLSFPTQVSRSVGRKYIGGFTENNNTASGAPSATITATVLGAAGNLLSPFPAEAGTVLCGINPAGTLAFIPFLSARVDGLWRTQRRRVPGVGI